MLSEIHRQIQRFAAVGLVLVLFMYAFADKGHVVIKSGPIKPSQGDEPGTLKGLLRMQLTNPIKGPGAPPVVGMTFDLLTESKDAKGRAHRFQLKGSSRTRPGGTVIWEIDPQLGGLALMVNGRKVDYVRSPLLANPSNLLITAYSSPFDAKAHPYGSWKVAFVGRFNEGKKEVEPPVVLVPGTPSPIPIPYPIVPR